MTSEIPERVIALVSDATGVNSEKLQPGTTLCRDLGMEGDDAVEFFEKFGREFAVDLTDLGRDWKFYFSPEGVPLATALLVVIPSAALAVLLEKFLPYVHGMVALAISGLLWVTALVRWNKWRYKNSPQISIKDLIESASSGKWTRVVPQEFVLRMNKPKFYDRFISSEKAAGGI